MSIRPSGALLGFCAVLELACSSASATPLWGISFGTTQQAVLYDVDPATGAATSPRPTGISRLVGIACLPDGTMYGLTNSTSPNNPNSLVSIDPATGASQVIGPTGLSSIFEGDLALDLTSAKLYGCYNLEGGQRQIFTIDTQTGAATTIPTSLSGDLSAIAFARNGTMYAIDTSSGLLLKIDKSTGALLGSQSLSLALGGLAGMAVDPATGTFYVADGEGTAPSKLYTLDPATGALTEIGPTGASGGLAGLTFLAPEPATWLLVLAGAALLKNRVGRGMSIQCAS
jgi:hypothetical protein